MPCLEGYEDIIETIRRTGRIDTFDLVIATFDNGDCLIPDPRPWPEETRIRYWAKLEAKK